MQTNRYPGPGPDVAREGLLSVRWRFQTLEAVRARPVMAGSTVYVGSNDDHLYALDARTGAERWHADAGGSVTYAPTVANDFVVAATRNETVSAYDTATGQVQWTFRDTGRRFSSPVSVGSTLLVSGVTGRFLDEQSRLYALDAATGEERWQHDLGGAFQKSPAVSNGFAITLCDMDSDEGICALDIRTGAERWRYPLDHVKERPIATDSLIFVRADEIIALDARTGTERWRFEEVARRSPRMAVDEVSLFAFCRQDYSSGLCAIDRTTGTVQWYREIPVWSVGPMVSDEAVYLMQDLAGDSGVKVEARQKDSGRLRWRARVHEAREPSSFAIAERLLVVGFRDGSVRALTGSDDSRPGDSGPQRHTSLSAVPPAPRVTISAPASDWPIDTIHYSRDSFFSVNAQPLSAIDTLMSDLAPGITRAYPLRTSDAPSSAAQSDDATSSHTDADSENTYAFFAPTDGVEERAVQAYNEKQDSLQEIEERENIYLGDQPPPPPYDSGPVYMLTLNAEGVLQTVQTVRSGTDSTGQSVYVPSGSDFGHAVAGLGDIDGNGVPDLAVGAPGIGEFAPRDRPQGPYEEPGGFYVLFLHADGTARQIRQHTVRSTDFDGSPGAGASIGTSLAPLGDLDGDGVPDVAVGGERAVWVLFLTREGEVRESRVLTHGRNGLRLREGSAAPSWLSGVGPLTSGDFDGNGQQELAFVCTPINARWSSRGVCGEGEVVILFLHPDGTVQRTHTLPLDSTRTGSDSLTISSVRSLSAAPLDEDGADALLISVAVTGPGSEQVERQMLRADYRSSDPFSLSQLRMVVPSDDPTASPVEYTGAGSVLPLVPLPDLNSDGRREWMRSTPEGLRVVFSADPGK